MKARSSRVMRDEAGQQRGKQESLSPGAAPMGNVQRNQAQLNNQQASVQAIRKRRSSINVYDQPSSMNSRLRQLETDMLRLDEDRTKLFDDTHSALAQSELKLNEIHAILKSRQDNVEKYVEDMKMLLQAKEEFEKQSKLLNEKLERLQEKFMHRETTISREIKLLKNKFELLEKNRQFKSILQKSNTITTNIPSGDMNESLSSEGAASEFQAGAGSGSTTTAEKAADLSGGSSKKEASFDSAGAGSRMVSGGMRKIVRIESHKLSSLRRFLDSLLRPLRARWGRFNKVSSVRQPAESLAAASDEQSTTTLAADELREAESSSGNVNANVIDKSPPKAE